MCGRARCTLRADDIPRACHRSHGVVRSVHMDRYRPAYNVWPGANLPVIRRDEGSTSDGEGFALQCMKWGLVPSFTKKTEKPDHYRMFNARSESVSEKASFRRLNPKNKCLVAVEGFYEWKKEGSKKQPYYIHLKDGRPLVFAALYDSWENSEGEILYTFTIITTSSSPALQWLHDRMPVILGDKESTDTWLSDASSSKYNALLKPYDNPDLVWYPVTTAMGSSSFDGPECIKEIKLKAEAKNPITKFFLTKGTNIEQDSKPEKLHDESIKDSLKEEPDMEEEKTALTSTGKRECDSKPSLPATPHESEAKFQTKRDYQEFIADSKPCMKSDKLPTGPVKKKGNRTSSGDNQPSLFSYFKKS